MNILGLVVLFVYANFRERIFVTFREVPLPDWMIIGTAAMTLLLRPQILVVFINGTFFSTWLPYFALTIGLPVLGTIFYEFKITNIYAGVSAGVVPLAFMILGASLRPARKTPRLFNAFMILTIVIQGVMAGLQFMNQIGYSNHLSLMVADWDTTTQTTYKETYRLAARSIGTFINPNELGALSLVLFWWSVLAAPIKARVLATIASLAILAASQSRGSLLGLVGSLGIWLGIKMAHGLAEKRSIRMRGAVLAFTAIIALLIGIVFFDNFKTWIPGLERWTSGLEVLQEGVGADSSFSGRLDAWRGAFQFMSDYPMGTLGPPQMLYPVPGDNFFINLMLQGSFFYLAAFLLFLGNTSALAWREEPINRLIGISCLALAINGISASTFYIPCIGLFWCLCGFALLCNHVQTRSAASAGDEAWEASRELDHQSQPFAGLGGSSAEALS